MSAETDFRALLAGHAGVAAIVGNAVAINAIGPSVSAPYVVFTAGHTLTLGLDNTLLADQVQIDAQCWSVTAVGALALADAVQAAVATAPAARGACITARTGGYDEETGLDAVILSIEWWA